MPCAGSYSSRHACDDIRIVNRHNFGNSHFAPLAVLTQSSPWEQLQTTGRGETAHRQKNRQRNTLAVKQIELIAIAKAFQYAKVTLTLLNLTSDIQTLSRQLWPVGGQNDVWPEVLSGHFSSAHTVLKLCLLAFNAGWQVFVSTSDKKIPPMEGFKCSAI